MLAILKGAAVIKRHVHELTHKAEKGVMRTGEEKVFREDNSTCDMKNSGAVRGQEGDQARRQEDSGRGVGQ